MQIYISLVGAEKFKRGEGQWADRQSQSLAVVSLGVHIGYTTHTHTRLRAVATLSVHIVHTTHTRLHATAMLGVMPTQNGSHRHPRTRCWRTSISPCTRITATNLRVCRYSSRVIPWRPRQLCRTTARSPLTVSTSWWATSTTCRSKPSPRMEPPSETVGISCFMAWSQDRTWELHSASPNDNHHHTHKGSPPLSPSPNWHESLLRCNEASATVRSLKCNHRRWR